MRTEREKNMGNPLRARISAIFRVGYRVPKSSATRESFLWRTARGKFSFEQAVGFQESCWYKAYLKRALKKKALRSCRNARFGILVKTRRETSNPTELTDVG